MLVKSHFPVHVASLWYLKLLTVSSGWNFLTSLILYLFQKYLVGFLKKKNAVLYHRTAGLRMEWDPAGEGISLSWNVGKSTINGLFFIFISTCETTRGMHVHLRNPQPQHTLLVHLWDTVSIRCLWPYLHMREFNICLASTSYPTAALLAIAKTPGAPTNPSWGRLPQI